MSALSPLSVNMVLLTVTGAISPVIVNVYTSGSVYTNGCYRGSFGVSKYILLDFSLSVKAATLIFISGCGSAISSA